jgi:hypothetical protein
MPHPPKCQPRANSPTKTRENNLTATIILRSRLSSSISSWYGRGLIFGLGKEAFSGLGGAVVRLMVVVVSFACGGGVVGDREGDEEQEEEEDIACDLMRYAGK